MSFFLAASQKRFSTSPGSRVLVRGGPGPAATGDNAWCGVVAGGLGLGRVRQPVCRGAPAVPVSRSLPLGGRWDHRALRRAVPAGGVADAAGHAVSRRAAAGGCQCGGARGRTTGGVLALRREPARLGPRRAGRVRAAAGERVRGQTVTEHGIARATLQTAFIGNVPVTVRVGFGTVIKHTGIAFYLNGESETTAD